MKMKISKLFLENFREFYGLNSIKISDFVILIGKNYQGKSTTHSPALIRFFETESILY